MKALYRKYRPKSLSEVIGQEKVTETLKKSLEKGKISHAYIFTGPRGTGKTSVARIFAHEINNFPYELEDSYVDIVEIDAASNRGIDDIRELREKSALAPIQGKYKVYIIDEFHMLTKEAFNALLKTLEEPPAHMVFILATTDIEKVPITITSRAQLYNFSLADKPTMSAHLKTICEAEKINIDDDALDLIVSRGGGSFRDSLSLLDQISTLSLDGEKITKELIETSFGLPEDTLISDLLNAYRSKNLNEISDKLKTALSSGSKSEALAESLIKKILENPDPIFFPLLSKLPEVKFPFPEAKLLLALVNFQPSAQPTQPFPPQFSPQKTQKAPKPPKLPENPLKNPQQFPDSSEKASDQPKNLPQNPATFSWEAYLENVKSSSLGAAMWLKKCQFSLENNTLNLFPPTPTVKGILESENNRQVLMNCLGSLGLKIHDSNSSPNQTKKDPTIDKINAIMGKTQEVISGEESPF